MRMDAMYVHGDPYGPYVLSGLDLRFTAIYLMPKPRLMVPQLHLVSLGDRCEHPDES